MLNRGLRYLRSHAIGFAALLVALGGTAVATSGGTSDGEGDRARAVIATNGGHSDRAVAAAKKKRGPRGPAGPQGPQGQAGPPGTPGANAVSPGGTIPAGTTLRGVWGPLGTSSSATATTVARESVSFGGFRLAARPIAHILDVGANATAECPGTAASPEASSGHLCVYIVSTAGAPTAGDQLAAYIFDAAAVANNGVAYDTFTDTPTVLGDGKVDALGFLVEYINNTSNVSQATGTWAVTS